MKKKTCQNIPLSLNCSETKTIITKWHRAIFRVKQTNWCCFNCGCVRDFTDDSHSKRRLNGGYVSPQSAPRRQKGTALTQTSDVTRDFSLKGEDLRSRFTMRRNKQSADEKDKRLDLWSAAKQTALFFFKFESRRDISLSRFTQKCIRHVCNKHVCWRAEWSLNKFARFLIHGIIQTGSKKPRTVCVLFWNKVLWRTREALQRDGFYWEWGCTSSCHTF